MTASCAGIDAAIDEAVTTGVWPPGLSAHVDTCPECQARLALAERIERALATWPVPAPPPHFAAVVAARARAAAWRQEVVVDWGFNLALAASLVLIAGGVGGFLWLLGAQASAQAGATAGAGQALGSLVEVAARWRGQGPVLATAVALLVTAAGGWWWAEERRRW